MTTTAPATMTDRERFLAVMEYKPVDRVPHHEAGVWGHTRQRWLDEGLDESKVCWDWFSGDPYWGMDKREFIPVNYEMIPTFEHKVLEETEDYEIIRHWDGSITKALKTGMVGGTRASMDQHLEHPVKTLEDWPDIARRYDPADPRRQPADWRAQLPRWRERTHPLILARNCQMKGYYWRAREWMGTEALSFAWLLQPELCHSMMDLVYDITVETSRPILEELHDIDYVFINEDLSMRSGPLLGPNLYREFIFPRMKKMVEFFKSKGVKYVLIDTDGNCDCLISTFMDAGVDGIWPLERASDMDPIALRKKYGRQLRLWGGVDKRELAKDRKAIDAHLQSLAPLIEDGGFIPTVDHTVPPDVSLDNFRYYNEQKLRLLRGEL